MRRCLGFLVVFLLLLIPGVASAGVLPPGGTFIDDDDDVHEGYIEALVAEGIVQGCNAVYGDEYCPDDDVSRAEIAALVVRALGLTDDGGKDWFVDDDGKWYETDVNRLAAAGIVTGCNEAGTHYCPEDSATRAEIAVIWTRAWNYTDPGPGDFFDDDDGTWYEPYADLLANAGITMGCNPSGTLFCGESTTKRNEIASFTGRAEGLTEMVPPPRIPLMNTVHTGLARPLFLTSPPGDDRQFIVLKDGRILLAKDDVIQAQPFLDMRALVSTEGERGLLGLAFHPDYDTNGKFYVSYTDTAGDSRIREYRRSSNRDLANPGFAVDIIEIDQPNQYTNHNGGMIAFDPNGYLLIGMGDGGGSGDPFDHGEDPTTLLGAILRIDPLVDAFPADSTRHYAIPASNPFVGTAAGADEVWAYGVRNPWRFSVDHVAERLYIGDVGQNAREEINVADVDEAGLFYGWNHTEGTLCYEPSSGCNTANTTFPVYQYGRGDGCSVTGGYVYRGRELPEQIGSYFFSDFCGGDLWSFEVTAGGAVSNFTEWSEFGDLGSVTSLGTDGSERLYVITDGGTIYRFTHLP